jgi:hypothetical protein
MTAYDWVQRELNRFYYTLYDSLKALGYTGECKVESYELHCTPCPIHIDNNDSMIIKIAENKKYFKCNRGEYDFITIAIALRMKVNPQKELK